MLFRSLPANQSSARKKQSAAEPEPYVHKEIKLPEVRLPLKTKLLLAAVVVGISALFAAITIPTSMKRDADRSKIVAALQASSPVSLNTESEIAVRKTNNDYLFVVTGDTVTKEQAIELFKVFSLERSKVRGSDPANTDALYKGNTLRLAHAGGGYLIENASVATLESGEAVKDIS